MSSGDIEDVFPSVNRKIPQDQAIKNPFKSIEIKEVKNSVQGSLADSRLGDSKLYENQQVPRKSSVMKHLNLKLKKRVSRENSVIHKTVVTNNSEKLLSPDRRRGVIPDQDIINRYKSHSPGGTKNFFRILGRLKKIANKIKKNLRAKNINNVSQHQFNIINDNSYFPVKQKPELLLGGMGTHLLDKVENLFPQAFTINLRNFFKYQLSRSIIYFKILRILQISLKRLFKKVPVMDPGNKFYQIWNWIILFCSFLHFFFISIEVSFEKEWHNISDSLNSFNDFFQLISILVFCFDIFIKLNTGFYKSGLLVTSRLKIIKNYLLLNIWIDFISLFPLMIPYGIEEETNYYKLLFYLRIIDCKKKISDFEDKIVMGIKSESLMSLFNLSVKMGLIAHFFACLWIIIGKNGSGFKNTWLKKSDINQENWVVKYISSLYFSFTTMLTVGYGDISATNPIEMIFSIILMIIGCAAFGYFINGIGSILDKFRMRETQLKSNIKIMMKFMRRKRVENNLQARIRTYFEFLSGLSEENVEMEELLISKLPETLRDELLFQTKGKFLKKLPLFTTNFSPEFLRKVVHIMKEVQYSPDDIIFQEGEDNHNLYVIIKGEVEAQLKSQKRMHQIAKFRDENCFNVTNFFLEQGSRYKAKSLTFTTVFKLEREKFIEILHECKDDYEKFCLIKDKILLYSNFDNIFTRCYSCNDNEHSVSQCPYLFYRPNPNIIIGRYNLPEEKRRKRPKRKNKKTKHAYCYYNGRTMKEKETMKKILKMQERYKSYVEDQDEEDQMIELMINEEENLEGGDLESKNEELLDDRMLNSRFKESMGDQGTFVTDQEMFRDELTNGMKRSQEDLCKMNNPIKQGTLQNGENQTESARAKKNNGDVLLEENPQENLGETKPFTSFERAKSRVTFNPFPLERKASEEVLRQVTADKKDTRINDQVTEGIKSEDEEITQNVEKFIFFKDFDKLHSFKIYFIHNNAENIIKDLKIHRARKRLLHLDGLNRRKTNFFSKRAYSRKSNDTPLASPMNGLIFWKNNEMGEK